MIPADIATVAVVGSTGFTRMSVATFCFRTAGCWRNKVLPRVACVFLALFAAQARADISYCVTDVPGLITALTLAGFSPQAITLKLEQHDYQLDGNSVLNNTFS